MKRSYYLMALSIPLSMLISFTVRGVWSYTTLIYAFGLLPLIELGIPTLAENLSEDQETAWKAERYFDYLLWVMVPLQLGLLLYFCFLMREPNLERFEVIGLITAMGIGCGVLGINVGHELGHRNNRFEQTLAKILLSTSLYWHFFIEHNRGHHKHVSTPLDPETSRLNEPLYSFWFRSIKDSFLSAFKIDPGEMRKAIFLQALLLPTIFVVFGKLALIGFLGSALFGILLLESVNYIEHYGLMRKETAPNRFEKVQPHHSWNADNPLSRIVLFDLSRHSDHHANINRKYQILRHHDQSPQMPTGYPGMLLLSLVPPLWFRVMNKRITDLASSRADL